MISARALPLVETAVSATSSQALEFLDDYIFYRQVTEIQRGHVNLTVYLASFPICCLQLRSSLPQRCSLKKGLV